MLRARHSSEAITVGRKWSQSLENGKKGMEMDSFNKDGEVKGSPHVLFIHTHICWTCKTSSRSACCLTHGTAWISLREEKGDEGKKEKFMAAEKGDTRAWETEREEVGVRLWSMGCRRNNEGIKKITDTVCIYIGYFMTHFLFFPLTFSRTSILISCLISYISLTISLTIAIIKRFWNKSCILYRGHDVISLG